MNKYLFAIITFVVMFFGAIAFADVVDRVTLTGPVMLNETTGDTFTVAEPATLKPIHASGIDYYYFQSGKNKWACTSQEIKTIHLTPTKVKIIEKVGGAATPFVCYEDPDSKFFVFSDD